MPNRKSQFTSASFKTCTRAAVGLWIMLFPLSFLHAESTVADNDNGPPTVIGLSVLDDVKAELQYKWVRIKNACDHGGWDVYLSGYTLHLHYSYSEKQLQHLNSRAWGWGVGRSVVDKDGDVHKIYVLGFDDSHFHAQYMGGYAWTRYWRLPGTKFYGGLGYTAFIFFRHDILKTNYMPLPGAIELLSVRYRNFEVFTTFIPKIGSVFQGNTVYSFCRLSI